MPRREIRDQWLKLLIIVGDTMAYQFMDSALARLHPQWVSLVEQALGTMDLTYLQQLAASEAWLPGLPNLFAALSEPLETRRYLLLGESPYPRKASANGYAFWDNAVTTIWSETGLSKPVNRATSLRHLIKMLLHARGDLREDFSQPAIAKLNTSGLVQTLPELFQNLLRQGFLLLNASLVYEPKRVLYHAKHWRPFMTSLFQQLSFVQPHLQLVLFGRVAQQIPNRGLFQCFEAEHPYQLTFIHNADVLAFFKPLKVLEK